MSVIPLLSKSRGARNLLRRIRTVSRRFGITPGKFEALLKRFSEVTRSLGCVPTFPVTAVILKRHPEMLRELSRRGVEFAVHGYIHTDYGVLTLEEQAAHFGKAVDIFQRCKLPFTGFRAPFLRFNDRTSRALGLCGFPYDSSYSVHWDVVDKNRYPRHSRSAYDRLLDFYQPYQAREYLSLPRSVNGFVEIPVSIPDDEALVERLEITDAGEIGRIWKAILERTYESGELFTLQLHPERIFLLEGALTDVLERARQMDPPVWIATLRELADWWKQRAGFNLEVSPQGEGRYRVQADCSERATLLVRNCRVKGPASEWTDGYQSVADRDFVLESPTCPVVGVSSDCSPAAINFLRSEGFVVERSERTDNCGVYLGNLAHFQEADEKPLAQQLQQSAAPLLRYWRWPDRAKSALSVTGDIDSMTLVDFVLRIYENWRQSGR